MTFFGACETDAKPTAAGGFPLFRRFRMMRNILGAVALAALVCAAAAFGQEQEAASGPDVPVYEIYPAEEIPFHAPAPGRVRPHRPKAAVIIDDMGYNRAIADKFLDLDMVMTFSVFPDAPHKESIVADARARGIEIMLHMPMEPREFPSVNPGPDALLSTMPHDELERLIVKNLNALPGVMGVNNHMGSKITGMTPPMYLLFAQLKKRGLFFVDSLTTADSSCMLAARFLQIPFARRDIFIDHVQDPRFIRRQIKRLIRLARAYGEAVGIAHPHMETHAVFRDMLPELKRKVRLVPASEILHIVG